MALPQRAEPPPLVPVPPAPVSAARPAGGPGFRLLRLAFVALPLLTGVDKFFNVLCLWREYLAPEISDLIGLAPWSIMHAVGVTEIVIGVMVAFRPRVGGWLAAAWLWAIAGNLVILPGPYEAVLGALALSLGALALARPRARGSRLRPSGPAPWPATPA